MVDSLSSYHARRAMFIDRLGGKCVHCGGTKKLEFDHIDPTSKEFNVSKRLTHRLEKILPEIDKCQILCGDCHEEKTRDQEGRAQHGGHVLYKNGCRCNICQEGNRLRGREYARKNADVLNAKRRERRRIAKEGCVSQAETARLENE